VPVHNNSISGSAGNATLNNVTARFDLLVGDTTNSGVVNATDVSETKLKSGQFATSSTFRNDVTVSGTINGSDVSIVKSRSGTALPTAQQGATTQTPGK
jgi:hypothetical protein